jgi:hypothetical protein
MSRKQPGYKPPDSSWSEKKLGILITIPGFYQWVAFFNSFNLKSKSKINDQSSKPEPYLFSSIPFSFLLFLCVLCALCGS